MEEYTDSGPGTPLLIAPTSIGVNYGDRARDIQSSTGSKILLPKRINISLSGMVINRQPKYYTPRSPSLARAQDNLAPLREKIDKQKADVAAVENTPIFKMLKGND